MVQHVDVLICGSGSAGLCAATWLARHGISCKILEQRSGPMEMGQADGVQCRTVEVFESFGLSEDLLRSAYHVLEVSFWSANASGKLVRTRRTADTQPGLSHQPHVILNQAHVNGFLLDDMKRNGQAVDYGYTVTSVSVDSTAATPKTENGAGAGDSTSPDSYPVTVATQRNGVEELFKAKYVLGSDGAHSNVRRSLGYKMIGDSTNSIWGVMDIYPRTNFPDIRKKVTIHSASGNILIIPREGDSLVRFYIELPHGTEAKTVKLEDLHLAAKKILSPYTLEIAGTVWFSAYSIGQRLVDHFHKDHRIFLAGDACHTHSPKAGQGMNVSLQDGYNIGWKLAAVLRGRATPELLQTYSSERQKVAADLIDFDRKWSSLFSSSSHQKPSNDFPEQFIKAGRYTAGLTAQYADSAITALHRSKSELATGLTVGMRFPSAQVVRFCDARAMHLIRALPADGRWRIIVFPGDIRVSKNAQRLEKLAEFLSNDDGLARRFIGPNEDIDSFIEPLLVISGDRTAIEQDQIPQYFWPVNGKWRMHDLMKVFVDDDSYNSGHGHTYEKYGIDSAEGAVVVVRPDQYVSIITGLDDLSPIEKLFESFALRQG